MTPEQKFEHAIKVRNRSLGPDKATTISPYLDVEVTDDNKHFLKLTADDVNMHRVLQQSTCRHGVRRKVAKRTLNALGGISGLSGPVNGPKQIKELKVDLEFADSLEQYKIKEKQRKVNAAKKKKEKNDAKIKARAERAEKARAKRIQALAAARAKLGLGPDDQFVRHHVRHLNSNQLKVSVCVLSIQTVAN